MDMSVPSHSRHRLRLRTFVALLMAAAASSPAHSRQVGSKYYPPRPDPAQAMAGFAAVAGGWKCRGSMAAGALVPGAPPTDYDSTLVIEPIHDGHAYKISYELHFPDDPMVFSGAWYAGWDPVAQKVSYVWFDNMGSFAREAGGEWQGDRLVLSGEASPPPNAGVSRPTSASAGSGYAQVRDVLTRKGSDKLHWKGEMLVPGAKTWIELADDECQRSWPKS